MGRRLAFLVGNQAFRPDSGLEPLRGPANDVTALHQVLADPALGGFTVEMFVDRKRDDILPAVDEALGNAARNDLILIYYAGHGVLDALGRLCLATADTRQSARHSTSIPTDNLIHIIQSSQCDTVIVMLDCCFAGAIEGTRSAVASQITQLRTVSGVFTLTSSTALEIAGEAEIEADGLVMGRFTAAVVRGITSGDADRDRDGFITLRDLATHVMDTVRGQTPEFGARRGTGDPLIAKVRAAQEFPAALPPEPPAPPQKADPPALQQPAAPKPVRWFRLGFPWPYVILVSVGSLAYCQLQRSPSPSPARVPSGVSSDLSVPTAPPSVPRNYLVFFGLGSADLTTRAKQIIAEAASAYKVTGADKISVQGFTDTDWSDREAQGLSIREAQSVANELVLQGIPRELISIVGFGKTKLLVQTGDRVREPQNRRVEIQLLRVPPPPRDSGAEPQIVGPPGGGSGVELQTVEPSGPGSTLPHAQRGPVTDSGVGGLY